MKHGYIYKITIGPKYYFGQTINRVKRKSQHRRELERGAHGNIYMQRAYDKYREFRFETLHKVPVSELSSVEFEYVSAHITDKHCLNLAIPLPDGTRSITEETRRRMSESHKGQTPTKEARRKISEFHKGRKKSPEHVRRVVESRMSKGYTHSEETRRKIGDSGRGRTLSQNHKDAISEHSSRACVLVSPDGKKHRFSSAGDAAIALRTHRTNLSRYLSGARPWPKATTKGPTSALAGWTGHYE